MAAKSYSLDFDGYWRAPNIGGLPGKSGVYCVYACVHNVSEKTVTIRRLLYIGEAENIQARVAGHERWKDWERELKVGEELCFNAALISPAADRQRAEAAMIHHHKPPCNVEYVHTFPFDTTTVTTSGKNAKLDSYFAVHTTPATSGLGRATLLGGSTRW
jgi:hypothetical protein